MQNTVRCPKCSHEFNVEDVLAQQVEKKYQEQYARDIEEIAQRHNALNEKEAELKQQTAELTLQVQAKADAEIQRREKTLKAEAEKKAKLDYAEQLTTLKTNLEQSDKELKGLKKAEIENVQLKRQLESQRQDIELELEKKLAANEEELRKKFNEQLKSESEVISKREAERNEDRILQLQKQLDDQKKLAEEMRRKAEQNSQQLQGEIQELIIEEFLRETFPFDKISEVKKGQYGADVVQVVRNSIGNEAGTILYESKNTQNFGGDWIEKMKAEAAESKADVLVLVTKAMPKDKEHTEWLDGVWVCPFREFQGTARVLREGLLRVSDAYASQDNKEGKAQQLYNYLTSPKFADQMRRVLTNFEDLKDGYEKEKAAMQKIWKKRDTQLETVIKNLMESFTPIQVIAGSEIALLGSPEEELQELGAEPRT